MYGTAAATTRNASLRRLARAQSDVVTRDQLGARGVSWYHVDAQLRGGRWRELVPGVVVLHRGPLIVPALRWAAVLAAGEGSALCAWTALELHGLTGWERPAIHVVVRRGRHVPPINGVRVHESRRHDAGDVVGRGGLPLHQVERAAIDAAAWSASPRTAAGLLAAVVQQRLTTPARLRTVVDEAGRVRHRRAMLWALVDIEGGSQAMSEIDFVRLCRRAGLPEPTRQRVRSDLSGRRRYLDAEWLRSDGVVVVVEVDGVGHLDENRWYGDLMRQAELDLPRGHILIRIPAAAIRLEPARVVAILRRALRADAVA